MPPKKQARLDSEEAAEGVDVQRVSATLTDTEKGDSLSLNPIFACSGPRAGLLSYGNGKRALEELLDTVDDTVYQILSSAWEVVGVPAADYWCWKPQQAIAVSAHQTLSGIADVPEAKVPDPCALSDSFYSSRLAALRGRGYKPNSGLAVIAVDRRVGNGSKLFNVLSRDRVADFVSSIPRPYDRSLYVLLDEQAPLDPYFDIDGSYGMPTGGRSSDSGAAMNAFAEAFPWWASEAGVAPVEERCVEELLCTILVFLKRYFEKHLNTKVEQCLVLTSSMQLARNTSASGAAKELLEAKLSFHVHFRLHERHAIASVRDMHLFMSQLRSRLDSVLASHRNSGDSQAVWADCFDGVVVPPADTAVVAGMVRRCVDFGVYSRWRAFRLPYNVKTPFAMSSGSAAAFTPVDAAVDDLLTSQLAQSGVVAEVPNASVGEAARSLVHLVVLSADPALQATQARLVRTMSYLFRFLVPVVAGVTRLHHAPLRAFLESHAPRLEQLPVPGDNHSKARFGAAVMELALIQRGGEEEDSHHGWQLLPFSSADAVTGEGSGEAARGGANAPGTFAPPPSRTMTGGAGSPFADVMPPMPHSARVAVTDPLIKALLAEVFVCLAPQFSGVDPTASPPQQQQQQSAADAVLPAVFAGKEITGHCLSAQYEESIRAYYVVQKHNKYCLRQARAHKATYAQLYLTYGSIKVRCYANDCCERCLFVPWHPPPFPPEGAHFSPGFPKYNRLTLIRDQLFPPLPLDELVRRYGPHVLEQIHKQQQQQEDQEYEGRQTHQQLTAAAI